MRISTAIRITLALTLLYFSYFETGWATTAILFLILIGLEATGVMLNRAFKAITEIPWS